MMAPEVAELRERIRKLEDSVRTLWEAQKSVTRALEGVRNWMTLAEEEMKQR